VQGEPIKVVFCSFTHTAAVSIRGLLES